MKKPKVLRRKDVGVEANESLRVEVKSREEALNGPRIAPAQKFGVSMRVRTRTRDMMWNENDRQPDSCDSHCDRPSPSVSANVDRLRPSVASESPHAAFKQASKPSANRLRSSSVLTQQQSAFLIHSQSQRPVRSQNQSLNTHHPSRPWLVHDSITAFLASDGFACSDLVVGVTV